MSLFGSSPPDDSRAMSSSLAFDPNPGAGRNSLFDDEPMATKSTSSALFADDDDMNTVASGTNSPWDMMPTPRRQQSRADQLRSLLPTADVPDSYIETFDVVAGQAGYVDRARATQTMAAAKISADSQARVLSLVASGGDPDELQLGRNQFNVLLALIGLAQEGDTISLDSVDERRHSEYS
jgi:sorting nexin-8